MNFGNCEWWTLFVIIILLVFLFYFILFYPICYLLFVISYCTPYSLLVILNTQVDDEDIR